MNVCLYYSDGIVNTMGSIGIISYWSVGIIGIMGIVGIISIVGVISTQCPESEISNFAVGAYLLFTLELFSCHPACSRVAVARLLRERYTRARPDNLEP